MRITISVWWEVRIMFKLVSAEIGRLLRSKLFYLAEFVMAALAVFISLMLYADMKQGYFHAIDHGMFFSCFTWESSLPYL